MFGTEANEELNKKVYVDGAEVFPVNVEIIVFEFALT